MDNETTKIYDGYIAFILDDESVDNLKEVIPPMHEKIYYHHMTVAYKPSIQDFDLYKKYIGTSMCIDVTGTANDSNGQVVLLDTNISEKKSPHITLSCTQYTKPNYSNFLAENKINFKPIKLSLCGKFEYIAHKPF